MNRLELAEALIKKKMPSKGWELQPQRKGFSRDGLN